MLNLLAADINLKPGGDFSSLQDLTIGGIITGATRLTLVVAALVFFFILVIGGIRWIVSGGDKANTEAARSQITAALVGLVIVFAAWAIVQLINTFFGINIFELTLPTAG
jgi:hypothetical protein